MQQTQPQNVRDATRAAWRLAAYLLAEDLAKAPPDASWVPAAQEVLVLVDRLDVVENEEIDQQLEELARAHGIVWLELAEDGYFDGQDFVAHVLFHFDEAGYSGSPFVQHLLKAIDSADEDNRAALSGGFPEYVGLWRACTSVADGRKRLVAVMDRK